MYNKKIKITSKLSVTVKCTSINNDEITIIPTIIFRRPTIVPGFPYEYLLTFKWLIFSIAFCYEKYNNINKKHTDNDLTPGYVFDAQRVPLFILYDETFEKYIVKRDGYAWYDKIQAYANPTQYTNDINQAKQYHLEYALSTVRTDKNIKIFIRNIDIANAKTFILNIHSFIKAGIIHIVSTPT